MPEIYLEKNNYENSDAFDGQSHKNLANLINEYLHLKEAKIQLIGLEGRWGSGKSNLIRILKNKNKDFMFFIYDAWAFQEEKNLKYSILLNFLNFLKKNRKKVSYEKLDELFSEISTSNSANSSNLEANSYVLAECIGSLLRFKGFEKILPAKQVTNNINKQIKKHKQILDFREFLKEIDKILDRKTIIVIDNIDRLPREKTKEIYSFINTFFAKDEYDENDKYTNIKVIIPYDKDYLNKVFENFADEFIQKSFDISFMVPKQLPDDWKRFFDKKYRKLFDDNNEELESVKDVFENNQSEITPRKIICFLNELKYIHKFHTEILEEENNENRNKEIPINLMALFVVKKEEILKDPIAFIFDEDNNKIYKNFIENMTSIIYMVKKEKTNAILEANIKELLHKVTYCYAYTKHYEYDSLVSPSYEYNYLEDFGKIYKSYRNVLFEFVYKKAINFYKKGVVQGMANKRYIKIGNNLFDITYHKQYCLNNKIKKVISQELMQDFYNEIVKICQEKGIDI